MRGSGRTPLAPLSHGRGRCAPSTSQPGHSPGEFVGITGLRLGQIDIAHLLGGWITHRRRRLGARQNMASWTSSPWRLRRETWGHLRFQLLPACRPAERRVPHVFTACRGQAAQRAQNCWSGWVCRGMKPVPAAFGGPQQRVALRGPGQRSAVGAGGRADGNLTATRAESWACSPSCVARGYHRHRVPTIRRWSGQTRQVRCTMGVISTDGRNRQGRNSFMLRSYDETITGVDLATMLGCCSLAVPGPHGPRNGGDAHGTTPPTATATGATRTATTGLRHGHHGADGHGHGRRPRPHGHGHPALRHQCPLAVTREPRTSPPCTAVLTFWAGFTAIHGALRAWLWR